MDLSDLYEKLSNNLKDSDDMTKAAMKASLQRIASGDYTSPANPAEQKYQDATTSAVAGSLAPVAPEGEAAEGLLPKLKSLLGAGEDSSGAQLMNAAAETPSANMDMLKAAQQSANRQLDAKQRFLQQLAQRRGQ